MKFLRTFLLTLACAILPAAAQTGPTGPTITTTSLPNGAVNENYGPVQLTCANCGNPTWSAPATALPPGISLSSGGIIAGSPTSAGTFNFPVTATSVNESFPTTSSTSTLSITINPALSIAASTLPVANVNKPYSATVTGTGGTPPYTWSLTSSNNDGVTINASTGVISGTPTAAGQFSLSVVLTDSTGANASRFFNFAVAAPLVITTTSFPSGTTGVPYPTQTLTATGGQQPYVWSITAGALAQGLTLNGKAGTISGTPTGTGTNPLTLMVTDVIGNTATASLSLIVNTPALTITPTTLPNGTVGKAYSQTLTATGGTAPYNWTAGPLPPGLTIGATTGVISGTPTATGTYTFSVGVTFGNGNEGSASQSYTITIAGNLSITTTSLALLTYGVPYSQTFAATGGTPPYSWTTVTIVNVLGLTMNASTGVLSGTPMPTTGPSSGIGGTSITVMVTDAAKNSAQGTFTFTVVAPLTIRTTTLPAAIVNQQPAYSQTLAATGGFAPYSWAVATGTLPSGLTLNASTGAITGVPTTPGNSSFTVTVTDSAKNTAQQALSIAVTAALTASPATLPAATVGVAYSQAVTVTGGVSPYTFALQGSLPSGFSFSTSTGAITGTATTTESGSFTIVVTDSAGHTVSLPLTLTVNNPPAPTVTLAGVPATSGFEQQIATIAPTISAPYPANITGTVVLTFAPSVTPPPGSTGTIDDLMIQFSNGSRTVNFTIPAGSTTAPNITVMTGTTAGTITLTTSGSALAAPSVQTIVNSPGVPFISTVTLTQVPGGVSVTVTGFSSTRDMSNGQFSFVPGTGDSFLNATTGGNVDVSVAVNQAFEMWWADTAQSNPYGTAFTLTVPFTFTFANGSSVSQVVAVSVTVTMSNSKGASNPVTLSQ
jgi:hypothetical protein